MKQKIDMSLIGLGLYSFSEASILTGIPIAQLHRWMEGYTRKKKKIPSLWDSEISNKKLRVLSFHDLLEVRFVYAFRKYGVSLQTIRIACLNAQELFESPYPFTCKRFQTDGRNIFAKALEETGEEKLLDLAKKQYAFSRIITPSLYAGIEFSDGLASRWYHPKARNKSILLDPQIAFGKPVTADGFVRTTVIYESFRVEKDKKLVSSLYDIKPSMVDAAIKFEECLAA